MREGRKFPACSTYKEKTGQKVGVAVGGLDINNNPLKSAEIYFDINGEWMTIAPLRSAYGMGTLNVISNRLLHFGGLGDNGASDLAFVHNDQTGWHLSNLKTSSPKSGHVSVAVKVGQLSMNNLGRSSCSIFNRLSKWKCIF